MFNLKSLILKIEESMLGTSSPGSELRSALRKAQVQRVLTITPMMMTANIVNALTIAVFFARGDYALPVLIWSSLIIVMGAFGLFGLRRFKMKQSPVSVGTKVIRNLTTRSVFLALLWGLLPISFLFGPNSEPNALIIGITAGMIGGGAIALSFIPSAMIGFVGPFAIMSAVGIGRNFTAEMMTLCVLLLIYSYVLMRGGYGFAASFAKTVSKELDNREHAETISLLLNEYQEGARDWIWEADIDGNVTRGAEDFAAAIGVDISQWNKLICLADPCMGENIGVLSENYEALRSAFLNRRPMQDLDFGIGFSEEQMCWFEVSGRPLYDTTGNFKGFRGFAKNRTREVQDKKHIEYLAGHDSLTGLYNRATFLEQVNDAIEDTSSDDLQRFAVLYIDLDGFKQINDTKGHGIGDAVLSAVAQRLNRIGQERTRFARIGGDEFAGLVPLDVDSTAADKISNEIVEGLSLPFLIQDNVVLIGASVGIAKASRDGQNAEALINAADVALYHAKANGKNCAVEFKAEMNEGAQRLAAMREALKLAIVNGELALAFQPFFHANSGRLAGFEALARWNHAEFGDVAPGVFIPIAEEAGLIDKLGDWVLRQACQCACDWPEHLRLAVNVSVPQFQKGGIANRIQQILADTKFSANRLELEITEAVFAERAEEVLEQIKEIKSQGIAISLDDFGTGYSSLMYLVNFPFDKLKIDQSFVRQAQRDDNARNVLTTIAQLGKLLNMETTIEGIEKVDQLPLIEDLNCTYVQGYHFGRPMSVNDLAICIANDTRKLVGHSGDEVVRDFSLSA